MLQYLLALLLLPSTKIDYINEPNTRRERKLIQDKTLHGLKSKGNKFGVKKSILTIISAGNYAITLL